MRLSEGNEYHLDIEVSKEDLLNKSPKDLADFINNLYENGSLETFLDNAVKDDQLVALLSWWEKWFTQKARNLIDQKVKEERKEMMEDATAIPLRLDEKYTEEEMEMMMHSIIAIQPTFGCSRACKTCMVDAVPRVRDEFKFEQLENLLKKYGGDIQEFMAYYGSEPHDYKRFIDFNAAAEEHAGVYPIITTAEFKDEKWVQFLIERTRERIRLSGKHDDERVIAIRERTKKKEEVYLDGNKVKVEVKTGHLGIAFHKDDHNEGYGINYNGETHSARFTLKTGIVITPRGVYTVMNTDLSERYPQGHLVQPLDELSNEDIAIGDSAAEILGNSIPIEGIENGNHKLFFYRKSGLWEVKFDKDEENPENLIVKWPVKVKSKGIQLADEQHSLPTEYEDDYKDDYFGKFLTQMKVNFKQRVEDGDISIKLIDGYGVNTDEVVNDVFNMDFRYFDCYSTLGQIKHADFQMRWETFLPVVYEVDDIKVKARVYMNHFPNTGMVEVEIITMGEHTKNPKKFLKVKNRWEKDE